jgi:hypothetical protein
MAQFPKVFHLFLGATRRPFIGESRLKSSEESRITGYDQEINGQILGPGLS